IEAYLSSVCRYCVELTRADCAAIVYLADSADAQPQVIAPDDRVRTLVSQTRGTAHPCQDCLTSGQIITVADIGTTADRWPAFTKAASRAGFSAATFVPVGSHSSARGAVALFGQKAPDAAAMMLAVSLADAADAGLVLAAELHQQRAAVSQLQHALSSRIVIEQAKGILSERWKVGPDDAFDALRQHARASQRALADDARDIINGT